MLDPDTGVTGPEKKNVSTRTHVSIDKILSKFEDESVQAVIVFDQAFLRKTGSPRESQAAAKLAEMARLNGTTTDAVLAFYYWSHATFLFVSRNQRVHEDLMNRLREAGIPASKLLDYTGLLEKVPAPRPLAVAAARG